MTCHTVVGYMDIESTSSPSWLVQTKLLPPELHVDVNARPRLVGTLLHAVRTSRLTLLSAPAGYGKTTLLASLPQVDPDLPIAWISLDEEDNDPARFIGALIEVIRRVNPGCCSSAQVLLDSVSNPVLELRRVVGVLINEIVESLPDPFVVVLDDLHVVTDPAILSALDYLLERMPAQMHLIIATRHDPPLSLARLRAHRRMTEIRLADLRFTVDEVADFLNDSLGLDLTTDQLAALQLHTEGWAAGLSLAVSSLGAAEHHVDRDAFIQQVAESDQYIFEFLAQEVLTSQDDEARHFLLRTSILHELTPRLCAAVTGHLHPEEMLSELHRRNLFVSTINPRQQIYRYHDLFRTFLREHLQRSSPGIVAEIHCHAARAETNAERALQHYQAAGMWDEAADLVEFNGRDLVQRGSFDTLRAWINPFPDAVLRNRPWLSYLLGVCAWETLDAKNVRDHLETARAGFEAQGNDVGLGETIVYLATYLGMSGDMEGSIEMVQLALSLPIPTHMRVSMLAGRAWLNATHQEWAASVADLDEAVAIAEESDEPEVIVALAARYFSPLSVLPEGVHRFEHFCQLALSCIGTEPTPARAIVLGLTAWTRLWRGDWPAAIALAKQALVVNDRFGGQLWVVREVGKLLPVAYAFQGDDARSQQHFDTLRSELESPQTERFAPPLMALYHWNLARVRWHQGRIDEARASHANMLTGAGAGERLVTPTARAVVAGLLAISDNRYDDAERHLEDAVVQQDAIPMTAISGTAVMALAYLRLLQGRPDDALSLLTPVLERHEREDTPGMMLWDGPTIVTPLLRLAIERDVQSHFARRTLSLAGVGLAPQLRPSIPETGETLTTREIEVLRLIAAGYGNPAIADQLYISIHTVKRHVANLLDKLSASSRTQAAVRARELGII